MFSFTGKPVPEGWDKEVKTLHDNVSICAKYFHNVELVFRIDKEGMLHPSKVEIIRIIEDGLEAHIVPEGKEIKPTPLPHYIETLDEYYAINCSIPAPRKNSIDIMELFSPDGEVMFYYIEPYEEEKFKKIMEGEING